VEGFFVSDTFNVSGLIIKLLRRFWQQWNAHAQW